MQSTQTSTNQYQVCESEDVFKDYVVEHVMFQMLGRLGSLKRTPDLKIGQVLLLDRAITSEGKKKVGEVLEYFKQAFRAMVKDRLSWMSQPLVDRLCGEIFTLTRDSRLDGQTIFMTRAFFVLDEEVFLNDTEDSVTMLFLKPVRVQSGHSGVCFLINNYQFNFGELPPKTNHQKEKP